MTQGSPAEGGSPCGWDLILEYAVVAMCVFLMAGLPRVTWERFVLWLVAGLVVYFAYGRRHSRLATARVGRDEGGAT